MYLIAEPQKKKRNLTEIYGEIERTTIIMGDFNISLAEINGSHRGKKRKKCKSKDLTTKLIFYLVDIKILQRINRNYTFFS